MHVNCPMQQEMMRQRLRLRCHNVMDRMIHLGGGSGWPCAGPLLAATPGMFTLTLVVPCASLRDAPGHIMKQVNCTSWHLTILLVTEVAWQHQPAQRLKHL